MIARFWTAPRRAGRKGALGLDITVPVSPYVGAISGESDVVFSLLNLAPTSAIRLKLPPAPAALNDAHFTYSSTSIEALAEVGITSAVTVANKFSGKTACFNVEVIARTDVPNELAGLIVKGATIGVGFRIGVIAFNFEDEAKIATPALVAASTTLKMSSSVFEVAVLGAGLGALPAVKPLIVASVSPFDVATYQTLGQVEVALNDYLHENRSALTPVLLSVEVDPGLLVDYAYPDGTTDFKSDALAQTYAFERIYHGATEEAALSDPRVKEHNLSERVIRRVYETYLRLAPNQKPTSEAKAAAGKVLNAGRW